MILHRINHPIAPTLSVMEVWTINQIPFQSVEDYKPQAQTLSVRNPATTQTSYSKTTSHSTSVIYGPRFDNCVKGTYKQPQLQPPNTFTLTISRISHSNNGIL